MTATPKPVTVDFSRRKVGTVTAILNELKQGDSYIHDHTGFSTPFAVWIATRRSRLKRKFKSSDKDEDGTKLPDGYHRIFL